MIPLKDKKYFSIPLSELVDGAQYIGHCRNACVAVWHADRQEFAYDRQKFGQSYVEYIKPPELDNVYDVFYAQAAMSVDGSLVPLDDMSTLPELIEQPVLASTEDDPEGRQAFRDAIRKGIDKV